MSKVICDVCGTSYPETETQCPICGCVRPADAPVNEEREEPTGYTYVKGGRFSKSNVRKRAKSAAVNKKSEAAPEQGDDLAQESKTISKKNISLIIVLILLLAIVAVMAYFIITLNQKPADQDEPAVTEPVGIACTDLEIKNTKVELSQMGERYDNNAVAYPKGCTEEILYEEDSDGAVIVVDDAGRITCMGSGRATVTVTCGTQTKNIDVRVEIKEIPKVEFHYSMENPLTLTNKNEQQAFYKSGDVTADKLQYISENEEIATVDANGIIHAVGKGETVIHVSYGNVPLENGSCKVICDFADPDAKPNEGESVDINDYYFGSVYGKLTPEGVDTYGTSMKIGDKIQFGLMHASDRSKNIYFEWERTNPDDEDQSVVASEDKLSIERVSEPPYSGSYCIFKATYEGKEYYLKIRYYA